MKISGNYIGEGSVFFIAEAGVNHDGDLEVAKELIEVASEADADAVKFQTFDAERLVTKDAGKAEYAKRTTGEEESQQDMLRRYELSANDHKILKEHCERQGILFLSTPFDTESADLLNDIDVPAIKIGSGELTNKPLLEHVSEFGKPMLVSTGMSTMKEVEEARMWITSRNPDLDAALLHCTSEYPTAMEDVNLRAMNSMMAKLPDPVGYSDHTVAIETPGYAVAAGACIVEKHFTLDSSRDGPDHEASLEPGELSDSIRSARQAACARGSPTKTPTAQERVNRETVRKSLHAESDIDMGATFTAENISVKRPADGLPPAEFGTTIGKRAAVDLEAGQSITNDCIASESEP